MSKKNLCIILFVLVHLTLPVVSRGKECPITDVRSVQILNLPMTEKNYRGTFHCTISYDTEAGPKLPQSVLENLPILLKDHNALIDGFLAGRLWIMPRHLNKIFFTYRPDPGFQPKEEESSVCLVKQVLTKNSKEIKTKKIDEFLRYYEKLDEFLPYYKQFIIKCELGVGNKRIPFTDDFLPAWLEDRRPDLLPKELLKQLQNKNSELQKQ